MWWSETSPGPTRRGALAALAAVLVTSACELTPVYAPGGQGAALSGNVDVAFQNGNVEFSLGQALQDRLGPPQSPRYRLSYTLRTRSERVAITTAQSTNQFNLIGVATYQLVDTSTGGVAMSGRVDGFSSYNSSGISVSTQAAERDGYDRLTVILADKIMSRLISGPELSR
ncbi:LPS assembly lipoprotein LptE [Fluviibacterium sp. S390]|uniref:LPS assembly lipoprotein LptE n=1 Tax=Fluviibacterium sp. S390 TaxID=3415139 RepID=UPI003C7D84A9